MKFRTVLVLLIAATGLMMGGCKNKKQSDTENIVIKAPDYNVDSAFAYVKAQTDFGPRTLGSEAHQKCCEYLLNKLSEFCDTAYLQPFQTKTYDGKTWSAQNIIGSVNPSNPNRIVLASHWDSRPFADHDPNPENHSKAIDGANDGASGVGVLLEVARQLKTINPSIGIDFVFFDAEDYGPREDEDVPGEWWGLGSQYWAQNLKESAYTAKYGILLDMVGNSNAQFFQEQFSMRDAQPVVAKVWATAFDLGYQDYFQNRMGGVITDDHYYVNKYADFKMIDIIHYDAATGTGFDPVWHTMNDNIQNIDRNTLGVVGTTLLQVIKNEE